MRFLSRSTDPKLDLLREVPAFANLSTSKLRDLARLLDVVTLEPGRRLTTEGDLAHEFFVIVDGTAKVVRDGEDIALLDGGDVVGEVGLIRHEPRNADVVALTPVTVLVGSPRAFASLRDLLPGWSATVEADALARVA